MAKKQSEEETPEQPAVPEVSPDRDEESIDDDEDDEEDCFPCLACWQIIAIAVVVACIVIGVAVVAVVLLVTGGGDDDDGGFAGIGGGGGSGGSDKVSFPPDTVFQVEVENQYSHGSFGTGVYDVSFLMKEGQMLTEDATPTTTDIRANFRGEEDGVARFEVTVIIDFNVDGQVDCRDTFYPSVDINSGDFGEWSTSRTCTYTLGGIYTHSARVKVSSQ
mmetsp:Transcript_24071/g.45747  ORF Transcript_24071/g.45747 Transcript_24071/m.45747 type:complete len:219 (-) Transcript_24071:46-702(-)